MPIRRESRVDITLTKSFPACSDANGREDVSWCWTDSRLQTIPSCSPSSAGSPIPTTRRAGGIPAVPRRRSCATAIRSCSTPFERWISCQASATRSSPTPIRRRTACSTPTAVPNSRSPRFRLPPVDRATGRVLAQPRRARAPASRPPAGEGPENAPTADPDLGAATTGFCLVVSSGSQTAGHGFEKKVRREWLAQNGVEEAIGLIQGRRKGRHHDDWCRTILVIAAHRSRQLGAVHHWHHHVGQYEIDPPFPEYLEGELAIDRQNDLVAELAQHLPQHFGEPKLVVDDQDRLL